MMQSALGEMKRPEVTATEANTQAFAYGAKMLSPMEELFTERLLVETAKRICRKYKITFAQLEPIQRKFITHYRCHQCRLLPLHFADLSHLKRVRCRHCGQLVTFRNCGKYGRLRKEIATELMKVMNGVATRST
jgi:hypothetical protein